MKHHNDRYIDIEEARKIIREYEKTYNVSLPIIANRVGVPVATIHGIFFEKNKKYVMIDTYEKLQALQKNRELQHPSHINIQEFRNELLKIKKRKKLSIPDIAETVGLPYSKIHSILYDRRRKNVKYSDARQIMRRLAGRATEPTKLEREKLELQRKAIMSIENTYMRAS